MEPILKIMAKKLNLAPSITIQRNLRLKIVKNNKKNCLLLLINS